MAGADRERSSSTTGGRVSAGALEPELERRIQVLQQREEQPAILSGRDWGWIALLTLLLPVILLAIGWNL